MSGAPVRVEVERLFRAEEFGRTIRVRIAERNITAKLAAAEIGCSESTLCRVAAVKHAPDVENYLRIRAWLDGTALANRQTTCVEGESDG